MQYLKHADEPDHYEKHTTPRAGVVESPRRDDISVMKSRTTTIYVCSQTESTVEVLLFSSGSTVRYAIPDPNPHPVLPRTVTAPVHLIRTMTVTVSVTVTVIVTASRTPTLILTETAFPAMYIVPVFA